MHCRTVDTASKYMLTDVAYTLGQRVRVKAEHASSKMGTDWRHRAGKFARVFSKRHTKTCEIPQIEMELG
jgi:hypothetical protein